MWCNIFINSVCENNFHHVWQVRFAKCIDDSYCTEVSVIDLTELSTAAMVLEYICFISQGYLCIYELHFLVRDYVSYGNLQHCLLLHS